MPSTLTAGTLMRAATPSAPAPFATKGHSNFAITEDKLKILYISQYFPPETCAPAARVSELSDLWGKAGHEVTVLTGFPNHPNGIVPTEYRSRLSRLVYRERMHSINVVRSWLWPLPNRRTYERIVNYFSFFVSAAVTGSFLSRPDVLIATSPQLLVGLSGWWIAKIKRVPLVLEVRDLWPESLTAVGVRGHNSAMHRLLGKIAGFLYRRADRIVVVTYAFREYLIERWRVPPEKIAVVVNGVQTQIFSPRQADASARSELQAEGKFVTSFIGTLGMAHGLDTVIAAAEKLQSTEPNILFVLVGDGAERNRLIELAQSKGVANIRFVPQQAREKIPRYIAASDVCLVLLKKSGVFETVIPTKMLEFMSCGRPVILGVAGEAKQIIERSHAGLCIEPENSAALCEAILTLRNQEHLRDALGKNGRDYIVRNLSRDRTAIEYLEILKSMVTGVRTAEAVVAA